MSAIFKKWACQKWSRSLLVENRPLFTTCLAVKSTVFSRDGKEPHCLVLWFGFCLVSFRLS